jgi:hypothetical protein
MRRAVLAAAGPSGAGRAKWLISAALALLGVAVTASAWLVAAAAALADSPASSQDVSGDPRAGQAAGFVGDPALAVLIVVLIIVGSLVVTLAWVRATGGRTGTGDEGR